MSNETFNGKVLQALDKKADIDLLNVTDSNLSAKIENSIKVLETSFGSTTRFIHTVDNTYTPTSFGVGAILFNTDTAQLLFKQNEEAQKYNIHEIPRIVKQGVDSNGTWYKQYQNGILEQGGIKVGTGSFGAASISLPIPFKDTNYTVSVNAIVEDDNVFSDIESVGTIACLADLCGVVSGKTVNSFKISSKTTHVWFAKGLV